MEPQNRLTIPVVDLRGESLAELRNINTNLVNIMSLLTEKLDTLVDKAVDTGADIAQMKEQADQYHIDISTFLEGLTTPGAAAWKVFGV